MSARAALLAGALAAAACAPPAAIDDGRPLILVTVAPQAHLVERVAGELARVETLLPRGVDPHHFEPSLAQLRLLSAAEIWVKVGHPAFALERAWLDRLLAENPGLVVIDGSEGAHLLPNDPHVWLSTRHAAALASQVHDALVQRLPEQTGVIGERRDALLVELGVLEEELRAMLAPARGRWFLSVHPAWGYLAKEHGLEQVALEPNGREPDPRALADIIARARAAQLPVVFVEPQFHGVSARTVAAEIGARVVTLDPLAPDWDANLRRVAAALRDGSAP